MQAKPHLSKWGVILLVLTALAWPPLYSLFVHPHIEGVVRDQHASDQDLQTLLGAKRFTLKIPAEKDGWFLSLESVIDGVPKSAGSASVQGGSEITLLVRRIPGDSKIEYCWFTENQVSRGVLDDPLVKANVFTDRKQGLIQPGDWLFRGGRKTVQISPDKEAAIEVRLALTPPTVPEEA